MSDIAGFILSIQNNIAHLGVVTEDVVKGAVADLGELVIDRTPEDTGDTAGAWHFTIHAPSASDKSEGSKNAAISALRDGIKDWHPITKGEVGYITNCKPWAWKLEYGGYPNPAVKGHKTVDGFSKQAPAGMVGVSIEEFPELLAQQGGRIISNE